VLRSRSWRFVAVGIAVLATTSAVGASPEEEAEPTAVVALIGTAGANAELAAVLTELLERQGVKTDIESEDRFEPDALLSQGAHDARVRVFVVLRGEHEARLYFRSPLGERFLLRKLALRSGLDEVGRELIAQVVETSTVALLHSSAGISRDEASASLSEERAEAAPVKAVAAPAPLTTAKAPTEPKAELAGALGGHGFLQWMDDQGPVVGYGIEGALGVVLPSNWIVRGAVDGDYRMPQDHAAGAVRATTSSFALRAGADAGKLFGVHALLLGLGAGLDFDHAAARSESSSVKPAAPSDSTAPIFRGAIRYELYKRHFWVSAAVFTDLSAVHTHYDLAEGRAAVRVADFWSVRPGILVTLGWSSIASHDTGKK
jgi:hypothetical protein